MTLATRIRKAAEFKHKTYSAFLPEEFRRTHTNGMQDEHARIRPLIDALVECVSAAEFYASNDDLGPDPYGGIARKALTALEAVVARIEGEK